MEITKVVKTFITFGNIEYICTHVWIGYDPAARDSQWVLQYNKTCK